MTVSEAEAAFLRRWPPSGREPSWAEARQWVRENRPTEDGTSGAWAELFLNRWARAKRERRKRFTVLKGGPSR